MKKPPKGGRRFFPVDVSWLAGNRGNNPDTAKNQPFYTGSPAALVRAWPFLIPILVSNYNVQDYELGRRP
jgi:hypothetical protein